MILFLLCVILSFLLIKYFYKHVYLFNKHLRRFPSPPEVPVLGHALDFTSGKEVLDVLVHYFNTYGDIVRVKTGPIRQLLLISNYNLFQFVLTNTKSFKRSMDYKYFSRWLGAGLITSDGAKWKMHRQIITPTFHYQILEDFVDIFEKNAKILTTKFATCLDHTSVDIYKFVNLCTLDIICESAMGTSVNAQNNIESDYVCSVKNISEIIIRRCFSPLKMVDWIYFFTEDYKIEKKAVEIIHSYARSVTKHRQESFNLDSDVICKEKKRKKTFLDLLLEANHNGERLTLEEIQDEVNTFMFAGHDTTASAISFILYCLANHPEHQMRVLNEQKQIFEDNFARVSTLQDLKNMKYLELVIKESLRLYPPAAFFGRELAQDVIYEGGILPKGLTFTLFVFGLHRNPKYFTEPEKFLPNRFETDDGKMPFAFLPFGAGPRNCIGQKFAMAEIKSIVSRVVRTFELLPSIPLHELKLASQIILTSTNGIRLRFKKRI